MKAVITVAVKNDGPNNAGGAVITDTNGDILAEVSTYYERSNEIFAAYKTLFVALSLCRRLGVTEALIETNSPNLNDELQGKLNRNQALYRAFLQRVERMQGFTYAANPLDVASKRYREAKALADRGVETKKIITHVKG